MRRKARSSRKVIFSVAVLLVFGATSIFAFISPSVLSNSTSQTTTTQTTLATTTTTTTATATASFQTKILGKQIAPGYIMGNPIDIELETGMTFNSIAAAGEKVSLRFTSRLSGDVSTLAVNGLIQSGQPKLRVGLQNDNGNTPSGNWLSSGMIAVPSSKGFMTVNLEQPAKLKAGRTYHVVLEAPAEGPAGSAAIISYIANTPRRPLNLEDPDIPGPDEAINTLFYDGQKWTEQDQWPIFVVKYTDGRTDGQPFSLAAPWVIYTSVRAGQTVIPASTYKVGRIAFVIGKQGAPTDRLYFEVRNARNEVLTQGVFAESGEITANKVWKEVPLSAPVTLEAGNVYRIAVYSPGTDLQNAFRVYGHEFSYDTTIGYGGLQHQLVTSHDGGAIWVENPDADAIFKLTTVL